LFFVFGCASAQKVPIPDLSVKLSDPEKARIYIIRPPQKWYGKNATIYILDGEAGLGILKYRSYFVWERDAGPLEIKTQPRLGYARPADPLTIDVVAGEVYYIKCPIMSGKFQMIQISEMEGVQLLEETKAP